MTDETGSTGSEAISTELPADAPESFNSPREAAEYFTSLVDKKSKTPAESAEPATAETESSGEDGAAPREEATGETDEADPAEKPPLELPRSWTKDRAEHWNKLDPDTQEFLLEQDRKASAEVRRVQNEAAEKLKGLTAKEQQAEQARLQYEGKLADQLQSLMEYNNQQFSAVKSQADVDFLANEALRLAQSADPGERDLSRQYTAFLNAWQVHQLKMAGKKAELDEAEGRKAIERQNESRQRKTSENSLLIEKAPEFSDPKKLKAAQDSAVELFREKGFTDDELAKLDAPILDDHRMQLIINDALKYRGMMKAKTAVIAKPVPQVVRPGTSRPSGQGANSEREQALTRKSELNVKEATELYMLQQRPRRAS